MVAGFSDEPELSLRRLRTHPRLYEWIRRSWQAGATICSICTGAYLLAEAGILDGLACRAPFEQCRSRLPGTRGYAQLEGR